MQIDELKRTLKTRTDLSKHNKFMIEAMSGKIASDQHDLAIIIKQVHSIEKGLAMEKIRFGFGLPRIEKMLTYIKHYLDNGGDFSLDEIKMASDALWHYIKLHDEAEWKDTEYIRIKEKILQFFPKNIGAGYSGTVIIHPNSYALNKDAFEEIVNTRHSIRRFNKQPVDRGNLRKALELAMHAPSACNRQPVRVYVLDHSRFEVIKDWRGGVKSFIDEVDKLLIVTGQVSAFEDDELYQYSVSAGIFVGYLTLALHTYGIGSCVLQRSLIKDKVWAGLSAVLDIPEGEQSVCAIAIGTPEDSVLVPLSHRLSYERIVKDCSP